MPEKSRSDNSLPRPSEDAARVQRRTAITRELESAWPGTVTTAKCRFAARCTEAEAVVELQWMVGRGQVMGKRGAYGMRWRLVDDPASSQKLKR